MVDRVTKDEPIERQHRADVLLLRRGPNLLAAARCAHRLLKILEEDGEEYFAETTWLTAAIEAAEVTPAPAGSASLAEAAEKFLADCESPAHGMTAGELLEWASGMIVRAQAMARAVAPSTQPTDGIRGPA